MARDPRVNVGLLLGATILVFAALVALARYPSLFQRGRSFEATFRNVAGLNRGDEVRYGGLVVGSVTALAIDSLDPTRIRVRFRVRRRTPINMDSRASITQVGLLGEPYLNVAAGNPGSPDAPDGSTIPSEDLLSFQDAMTQLARFFERSDTLLTAANTFTRKQPFERLDVTLSRIDSLVRDASAGSGRVFATLDTTSVALQRVLERADRLIAAIDTTVQGTGPQLRGTQQELVSTLRDTRALVAQLRDAIEQGGGLDELVRDVSEAADNMARLSERVERDPTSLVRRRRNPPKPAGPPIRD